MKKPTLDDIASRINTYLKKFESDKKINKKGKTVGGMKLSRYWQAFAVRSGRFVSVTYIAYQGPSHLTRQEAEKYLAWLDAGNVGTHYQVEK